MTLGMIALGLACFVVGGLLGFAVSRAGHVADEDEAFAQQFERQFPSDRPDEPGVGGRGQFIHNGADT